MKAAEVQRSVAFEMRNFKFWIPILASIPATLFGAFFSFALAGVGHGSYSGFVVLFPYSLLSATLFQDVLGFRGVDWFFVVPVFIQFPLYGLALAIAEAKRRLRLVSAILLVLHVLAAAFLVAG